MKKLFVLIFLIALVQQGAKAAVDLSIYELKDHQLRLLRKLEDRGLRTEDEIIQLAISFDQQNRGVDVQDEPNEYIPPHSRELLEEIKAWAAGGAFSAFAKYAGYQLDGESYRADCPDWAVFNFGRATGTQFLKVDILSSAISYSDVLQRKYANSPETFSREFKSLALDAGMFKYFTEIE